MEINALQALRTALGSMDIYLTDQIQKGHITQGSKILDAGCSGGRNIAFFIKAGLEVWGADQDATAINSLKHNAAQWQPGYDLQRFRQEELTAMSFEAEYFDFIICNAVLHFAKNEQHFRQMLDAMWRLLANDGIFFCRLASSIGIEEKVQPAGDGTYLLPDGAKRYLVTETMLLQHTHRLGAAFAEPIKTVNVQNSRCMTTWVLRKQALPDNFKR